MLPGVVALPLQEMPRHMDRALPLQISHYARYRQFRRYAHEHMDVVGHHVSFLNLAALLFRQPAEHLPKLGGRARFAQTSFQARSSSSYKAYVDFPHLLDLARRGVFWVTRAKDNMKYRVRKRRKRGDRKILRDDLIVLTSAKSKKTYPEVMRRVVALVEVEGKEVEMVFLTNNLEWSARSVADLYRSRWSIEVFFKQIKQTLQLSDFLGHSVNAIRWQVWTALLVYLLLRYLAFVSDWSHSFNRLFTAIRSVLWRKLDLRALLERYGTASGSFRMLGTPQEAYLPGF